MSEKIKNNWVAILAGIVSTGMIGQVLGFWDVAIKREDDYIKKYIACTQMISEIEQRLNTLEMAQSDIPFPFWIKDLDFTVIHISKEYTNMILEPLGFSKKDLVGTQGQILGKEFSELIMANDALVLRHSKVMTFKEAIPNFGGGTSYKFPIKNKFGNIRGIGGIWIPDSTEKNK